MPGELLTCLWQAEATYALSSQRPVQKQAFQLIVSNLKSTFPSISDTALNDAIYDGMSFCNCKKHIVDIINVKGIPRDVIEEKIEIVCWDICKGDYSNDIIPEVDLFKLWQIFNRLVDENIFPATISRQQALWLNSKILRAITNSKESISPYFPEKSTFTTFLDAVKEIYSGKTEENALSEAIEIVHSWLVREVLYSGWVDIRIRNRANWITWKRSWCVLKPDKIEYYQDKKGVALKGKAQGSLHLTADSKIEVMNSYQSLGDKFKYTFKITNLPFSESQLSTESLEEKKIWLSCLEDVVKFCSGRLTPLQIALRKSDNEDDCPDITALDKLHEQYLDRNKIVLGNIHDSPCKKDERTENKKTVAVLEEQKEKIKVVFLKLDKDGNGVLTLEEFAGVVQEFGLQMDEKDVSEVFETIDKDTNDKISYEEFYDYFIDNVLRTTDVDNPVNAIRKAFLDADRNGNGTLNFKEFSEFVWERKRDFSLAKLSKAFDKIKRKGSGGVTFDSFQDCHLLREVGINPETDEELHNVFGKHLKQCFDETDSDDLAQYIQERWESFVAFKRKGACGKVVMTGAKDMVGDILPGEYNLLDLTCFSDLPPIIPKRTIIKQVKWESSSHPNMSGILKFPSDFNGVIETDFATNERLRYYGCSFADANQEKVSLLYRHGIQDFTYENEYMSEYVTKLNGGSGVEKHQFSHLDCPLSQDSGYFILAKFDEDEFHITAFKIPMRHTLYVPKGCIHSNDYLKGTWRTMLSDEASIDHVHLKREVNNNSETFEPFVFEFAAK